MMSFLNKTIIYSLFLTNISWAIDPGIIREINDINKQKLVKSPVNCFNQLTTPFETKKSSLNPEYNDCAVALCGMSDKNSSAWLTDANFSKSIPSDVKASVDKLSPTINKMYDLARTKNIKELARLKEMLKGDSLNQIDPSKFSQTFREDLDSLVFKPFIKEVIDLSKPIEERLSLQLTIPSNANPEFKAAIAEYVEKYKSFSMNDLYSFSSKKIYKDNELYDLAKSSFKITEESVLNNENKFNEQELKLIKSDLAKAKAILNTGPSSIFDSQSFFSNLNYTQALISNQHPEIKTPFSPPSCNSSECKKTYLNFIKNKEIDKNLEQLVASLDNPAVREQSINRCKASLISKSLKTSDKDKAKSVFMTAKAAIIKNVLPRFSEHSRKILLDYLNTKLNFNPINPIATFSKANPIENFKAQSENYLKDNSIDFQDDLEGSIRKGILINSSITNIDPFSDSASPCASDLSSNAWDSFLPIKVLKDKKMFPKELDSIGRNDQIFISDFSCTHEHRGKHAIAHEIGHALNSVFAHQKLSSESAKLYKKTRECVTENYTDPQKDVTFFTQPGDSIYSEEDTADLFAFMAFPNEKDLFTCSLLKPTYQTGGYTDLDFVLDDGDSHSTSFARVLIEAVNKNVSMPISCQRIISQDQPKMSFKKCM